MKPKDEADRSRKKIEIDGLDLDKETVQDLTEAEAEQVQGGRRAQCSSATIHVTCP